MITKENISTYQGYALMRGSSYLYILPHILLRPYIANYTITCPTPNTMSDQYTVLPTASATLVFSVDNHSIIGGLRGVNTKEAVVGEYANRFQLLLLIEFHPAGLYPFLKISQDELLDASFDFEALDKRLSGRIIPALIEGSGIEELKSELDHIFLSCLDDLDTNPLLAFAREKIVANKGMITSKELSKEAFYSEKHLNRLFKRHVGTGIKTFSRIVRVNHALRLLESSEASLTQVAAFAGYFDQSHFIRDLKALCHITPKEYIGNMSIFYNDHFKL